jgi:hypothetical protein
VLSAGGSVTVAEITDMKQNLRFEVFIAVKIQAKVFWVVALCSAVVLQHVGILPQRYMMLQSR